MRGVLIFFSLAFLCSACAIHPCLAEQEPSGQTLKHQLKADADAPGEGKPALKPDPVSPAPVRPMGTVTRPKNGVRYPDLDKAWAEYDLIVAKVTEDIRAAIKKEFQAAVTKGDLGTAEKWESIGKKFESDGDCKLEEELGVTGKKADLKLKSAQATLEKAYDSVVKALTKEKRIVQAKSAKSELVAIASTAKAAVKSKEIQKAGARFIGVWRWPDGTTEEVRADGAWITRGDPNDQYSGKWVLDLQDPNGPCVIRTTNGGRRGPKTERWYADPANPNVLRVPDGRTINREEKTGDAVVVP